MTATLLTTPVKPARVVNFAKIQPLFAPSTEAELIPARSPLQAIQVRPGRALAKTELLQLSRPGSQAKLAELRTASFAVTKTSGTISRAAGSAELEAAGVEDLQLPFGMPRFVNVATLKRMLRAKRSEVLLKRSGGGWVVCDNSARIDLLDDSVEFRLGAVQIFS